MTLTKFSRSQLHDWNCHYRLVWEVGDICFLWKHCYIFRILFINVICFLHKIQTRRFRRYFPEMSEMVELNSREKICHFIATQWEMLDVIFMLPYMFFDVLILVARFVTVLLTFTKNEGSDRKWQKSAHQFKCHGMLKSPCTFNLNFG